jgi:hypothetical protein
VVELPYSVGLPADQYLQLSIGLQEVSKEVLGTYVLPTRSLFGDGTPRRSLRRVSLGRPTSAPLRFLWEISPRVNSPKNEDPALWEPLHAEPTQTDALELLRE